MASFAGNTRKSCTLCCLCPQLQHVLESQLWPTSPCDKRAGFCCSSPGEQLLGPGWRRGRRVCAPHSASLLIALLNTDPVPVVLFTAGNRTKITNLFYPGLQSLISLDGEGWGVFFLSSGAVLTKVLMEAEQPPEHAAETFIELKWKSACQKD